MFEIVHHIAKGNFNSKDLGFSVVEHEAPSAEEVEIIEQIPFMQGQYDFSMLTGERIFHNRTVTVKLWKTLMEYEDRKSVEAETRRLLMLEGIDYIDDTWLNSGLQWYGKCTSISAADSVSERSLTLTIVFDVYPFAIRENSSYSDIFDEDYFTDDSADNWTGYYVNGSRKIVLINIGANSTSPKITATTDMTLITSDGNTIYVPQGKSQDFFLKLQKGTNYLTVIGNGHISFSMANEVMV